ncbi:hypothetical protein ACFZB6_26165 [Streptomyces syringium]|uniref:hypothetical protein n=1 Tax=Streptomyces syringium TaxID=76729 RepID=UPI0036EBF02D
MPFNRRVHVIVEVLDRAEELGLLADLCGSLGWPIREPITGETTVLASAEWTLRVIEVRIRNVRDGAVEQAVATLDAWTQAAELSVHCRDAALVERVHRPLIEWHLRGKRQSVRQRLRHALHLAYRTGEHDPHSGTVRLVRVPTTLDEPRTRRLARSRRAARARLSHHTIPARQLNPDLHEVSSPAIRKGWYIGALLGVIFTATMICLLCAGLWPAIGADDPRIGAPIAILSFGYLVAGTVLALRHTTTHRALPWLIPLAVPLAASLIPWLGMLVQRAYLSSFSVRPVSGEGGLGDVHAGIWMLFVFVATSLLPTAYLGWVRFLDSSMGARAPWLSWAPAVALGTGIGVAFSLLVLLTAARSGTENRQLAVTGKDIPEYFGVGAEYACVALPSKDAPYYGTRPPENAPVVIFGQKGDRVEYWNPKSHRKASVRLEDAQVRLVPHIYSHC